MHHDDLNERRAYFAAKLEDAIQRAAAKEPYPAKFGGGFTTENLKDWREAISLIRQRIAAIEAKLVQP
jgi:hypothetical protein